MDFFSPLIEQALELAAQWHDGTYRKSRWRAPAFDLPEAAVLRVPVMAHVTAVALTVQRAGWDEVAVAAAFLHDVLEDRDRYGQVFRRERMRELVGEAVAVLVETVTEQKLDAQGTFRSWRDRKEGYIAQLQAGTASAAAISLADKLHNLWSMNQSLRHGIDVFTNGPHRKAFSAGRAEQLWFYNTVMAASEAHTDARLVSMRARLRQEMDHFERLVGLASA